MTDAVLVLAANRRQFEDFLYRQRLRLGPGPTSLDLRRMYRYVTEDYHMRGYSAGTRVIVAAGSFWRERRDALKLWCLAEACDYGIEYEGPESRS